MLWFYDRQASQQWQRHRYLWLLTNTTAFIGNEVQHQRTVVGRQWRVLGGNKQPDFNWQEHDAQSLQTRREWFWTKVIPNPQPHQQLKEEGQKLSKVPNERNARCTEN